MRKLKIIHAVESYYPSVGGMQEVVKQLSERLAGIGHEVTVVTRRIPNRNFSSLNGVVIREFDISGNMVSGYTGNIAEYEHFLLNETGEADVISFFAAQQWASDLALPLLKKISAKKVNVPTGYSGLFVPEFKEYFEKMKVWMREYDANVFLSDNYRDIHFARENGINRIHLIPNGAAEDEFMEPSVLDIRRKLGIPQGHFLLLHVGSFTFTKGQHLAAEIFLKSGLKNATLVLVGNGYNRFYFGLMKKTLLFIRLMISKLTGSKRIICTSLSRKETVDIFREADLFIFPSMIECSPIVLFESMAAKTPFFVTDVGNAAEIVSWSGGGWIMPTRIDQQGFSHPVIRDAVIMLQQIAGDKIG
ncbi:MAG: glycosyltransferase family 4 protein, partial [Crocinitomicaceae bacterium]|nr:glycosyltransferase family 4 protein [Crocinitomicaceae bacterium]